MQKRKILWNNFYQQISTEHKITGRKFWEFREFYSPGTFVFKKNGLDKDNLSENEIVSRLSQGELFTLMFHSDKIMSFDSLSTKKNIENFSEFSSLNNKEIDLEGSNFKFFKINSKQLLLVFLLNNDEMKKTNGFFDYIEEDKKLTEGKNWLNVSLITID